MLTIEGLTVMWRHRGIMYLKADDTIHGILLVVDIITILHKFTEFCAI